MKTPVYIDLPSKTERHKRFGSVDPGPRIKPENKADMADLQNAQQDFLFDIKSVGVSQVKYPIIVKSDLKPTTQTTIGTFKLTSHIDRITKGTNMSRFLEQMEEAGQTGFGVDFLTLYTFADNLQTRLEQKNVALEVAFPWFYERKGPKSAQVGLNHADLTIRVERQEDGTATFHAHFSVYITTLCPCSKEISEYSAHSQRGKVTMDVSFIHGFENSIVDWKKALLDAAESNASAMIHPVLKRVDEKHVTETAYENPRFVEDIVRLVAADLYEMSFIKAFKVTCENEESIHLHNAIAVIEYDKENQAL
jgi:GTP cyclohydrolase I